MPLLGQDKCALDHIDARSAHADDHFDDVETESHLGPIQQPQPCARAAGDERLLCKIHGIGGASTFVARAGLHFGKDERVFRDVSADEVHLTPTLRAEIAVKDFAPVLAEIFLRELLAAPAERVAGIRARVPPGGPGEKSGDGLDKAHFFSALRGVVACRSPCVGQNRSREILHRARP